MSGIKKTYFKRYTFVVSAAAIMLLGLLPMRTTHIVFAASLTPTPTITSLKQDQEPPDFQNQFIPAKQTASSRTNTGLTAQEDHILTVPEPIVVPPKDTAADEETASKPHYKDGEVLVLFKKGTDSTKANGILHGKPLTVVKQFDQLKARTGKIFTLVRGKKGVTSETLMNDLRGNSNVESVSLNYGKRPTTTPNDTYFKDQWSLENTSQTGGTNDADIDATAAWTKHANSNDVVIALIDTGVDYVHPDLKNNIWVNAGEIAGDGIDNDKNGYVDDIHGIDTGIGDSDPMPTGPHGTHVAGIMAAEGNNGEGIAGINWRARIMPIQGFAVDGYMYDSAELAAMQYILTMKNKGVNIVAVNASYGCTGCYSEVMKSAIKSLGDVGITFVAAAGNDKADNDSSAHYPASYDLSNIISVAATDASDKLADYSNYGAQSVDLGAPGSAILSTYWLNLYTPRAGDVFFDDIETGNIGWIADTPWAMTTASSLSTSHAWTDSPSGNYANNQTIALMTPPIDLSGKTGELSAGFSAKFQLEYGYDFLNVYYVVPSIWATTVAQKHAGLRSWTDSQNGNYQNNSASYLMTNPIDLSGAATTVNLNFYLQGVVETGHDRLWVSCGNEANGFVNLGYTDEVFSTWTAFQIELPDTCHVNDAQITFALITDGAVTYDGYYLDDVRITKDGVTVFSDGMESGTSQWETFGERTAYLGYLTGTSDTWKSYNLPLITEEMRVKDFRLMFVLDSDSSTTKDGVYLDNIGVGEPIINHSYAWMNGTSMAAPHVTGAVAFLASFYDEPMADRINRLLNATDKITALTGKTVSGGRLNLANAVNSVASTPSVCKADFNTDGAVNDVDKSVFGAAFGSSTGQAKYNAAADFDHDGDVDGVDLAVFRAEYGRTDCAIR